MIALCREHADKADNGSFTDDQLRQLKMEEKSRGLEAQGRFDWMRQDLLAVVGGNFSYQTDVILKIGDTRCIWFERDENGYLLLNFRMPTITSHTRARIDRNFWFAGADADEVICPPSGRVIEVKYDNGDRFRVEFFNVSSKDELAARYSSVDIARWSDSISYPVTAVELWETATGTSIEFGPQFSRLPGNNIIMGGFSRASGTFVQLAATQEDIARLFPDDSPLGL